MDRFSFDPRSIGIKIAATLELARPVNVLLSVVGVGVGAILVEGWHGMLGHPGPIIVAMLSAGAIAAAANAENDARDVKIDGVNRPERPIPSGRINARLARSAGLTGATVGIALSLFLTPVHVGLAAFSVAAVYAYSYRVKRFGLIGNVLVALVVSATLIYGGLAAGGVGLSWVGFIAAFVLTLAREITKDLEDIEGDLAENVRTLPISIGDDAARHVVSGLIVLTIFGAPLPFLQLGFSGLYLATVALTCLLLLSTLVVVTVRAPETNDYRRASALLKTAMAVGMIALSLG